MSPNRKYLFRAARRLKTNPHRVSLPHRQRTRRVRRCVLRHAVVRQRLLQHRLAPAQLRHHRIGLFSVVGNSTIGNIVAVPTGRRVISVELRQINRRNVPRRAVHQQPTSALPLHRGAVSSGRLSFTRNTRRTTNSRSVTSCGAPSTYSLTRPSMTSARILMITALSFVPPANHCADVHFPNVMTWTFVAAPAVVVSSAAQQSKRTRWFGKIRMPRE